MLKAVRGFYGALLSRQYVKNAISVKKYDNKSNVMGELVKAYRTKLGLSKVEVCQRLQLHAVYIDGTELKHLYENFHYVSLIFSN